MPTIKGCVPGDEGEVQLGEKKVVRRYELEFVVLADTKTQTSKEINATVGLPKVGQSTWNYYDASDPTALCISKKAKRHPKNPLVWTVTCQFDSDPKSQSQENEDDENEAPDRPPIESWEIEYGTEVMHEDFDDPPKVCVNPCGEAFDPPLTRRLVIPVLVIKRIESAFGGAPVILQYCEHANAESFRGAPPGTVQMIGPVATDVYEDGIRMQEVTYRLRFNPQGWDAHVLNQGSFYRNVAGSDDFKSFLTKEQVPYVGNLKANGTKAAPGERTFSDFRSLPRVSFDPLNIE